MGYNEEKQKIIDCITENGHIIELDRYKTNLKKYCKILVKYSDTKALAIRFPGYKTTKNRTDYCVYLVEETNEKPISHIEIMCDLYNKTTKDNYEVVKKYIEEIAIRGRDISKSEYSQIDFGIGFDFDVLTDLMFYIAIQEDINYPDARYQGRKMCFKRYLEAIYCKVNGKYILQNAIDRAQARYIPQDWKDAGDLYQKVNSIQR